MFEGGNTKKKILCINFHKEIGCGRSQLRQQGFGLVLAGGQTLEDAELEQAEISAPRLFWVNTRRFSL